MSDFDEIRAYQDHEVNSILLTLLHDAEFLKFFAQQVHPKLNRFLPSLVQKNIQKRLQSRFENIHSIASWQGMIAPYVETLISKTIDQFTVKGIENLDPDKSYMFISNHRDIAMDPMLVNYALLTSGFSTSKVAIGDNLLGRKFVEKLMRLNKSFVVKRSATARREKLEASNNLSAYVHESIKQHNNVWIAQKEGRAKNGKDITDTAVLKMLHLAGRKLGWEFKDSMSALNIVPVCISYEWDPCDIDKAMELTALAKHGAYEKSKDEDLQSIVKGLKGFKGKVTVNFSKPLKLDSNQASDWSDEIDRNIYQGYEIYNNNKLAYELLESTQLDSSKLTPEWKKRFAGMDSESYQQVIECYAQPVIAQKENSLK